MKAHEESKTANEKRRAGKKVLLEALKDTLKENAARRNAESETNRMAYDEFKAVEEDRLEKSREIVDNIVAETTESTEKELAEIAKREFLLRNDWLARQARQADREAAEAARQAAETVRQEEWDKKNNAELTKIKEKLQALKEARLEAERDAEARRAEQARIDAAEDNRRRAQMEQDKIDQQALDMQESQAAAVERKKLQEDKASRKAEEARQDAKKAEMRRAEKEIDKNLERESRVLEKELKASIAKNKLEYNEYKELMDKFAEELAWAKYNAAKPAAEGPPVAKAMSLQETENARRLEGEVESLQAELEAARAQQKNLDGQLSIRQLSDE